MRSTARDAAGNVNRATPVVVTGLVDAVAIDAGRAQSCAIRVGGALSCWGDNREAGALGIGTLFFVLAAFGVKLPRSGPWMEVVKSTFGIALVCLSLLYLKDAFPTFRSVLKGLGDLVGLLADLGDDLGGVVPVETVGGRPPGG